AHPQCRRPGFPGLVPEHPAPGGTRSGGTAHDIFFRADRDDARRAPAERAAGGVAVVYRPYADPLGGPRGQYRRLSRRPRVGRRDLVRDLAARRTLRATRPVARSATVTASRHPWISRA